VTVTDREDRYLQQLAALLSDTDEWVSRVSHKSDVEPAEGSPLAGDDRHCGKFKMSASAWTHLTVAIDHLDTLRSATLGCDQHERMNLNLQLYGQFTLMRAIIENAASVLWMLTPKLRNDRILRRLRAASGDIRMNEAVRNLTSSPGTKTEGQRLDEVRAIAERRGIDPTKATQSPRFEEIVRVGGDATPLKGDLAVVMWRACSGLAHGDLWATIVIPGRVHLAPQVPEIALLELSPNVKGLITMLMGCKVMLSNAYELYERRCTSPVPHSLTCVSSGRLPLMTSSLG
jgi:hypothetical protein